MTEGIVILNAVKDLLALSDLRFYIKFHHTNEIPRHYIPRNDIAGEHSSLYIAVLLDFAVKRHTQRANGLA